MIVFTVGSATQRSPCNQFSIPIICKVGINVGSVTGIPLIYVIRKEDHTPDIETNYASDRYGELIARAPLSGTTYGKDNHCVFQIIKGLVLKGPAYAWIQL